MLPATRQSRSVSLDPFGVRHEMDQLFNRFFGDIGTDVVGLRTVSPRICLWEADQNLMLEADLPGVKKEDLDVTIEEGSLHIVANRPESDEDRDYWIQEQVFGRMERLITLPESVDPDSIDAELCDGVLCVTLKKRPEAQPTRIQVRGAGESVESGKPTSK